MREFRDEAGIEWRVSLTPRGSDAVSREHFLPESYREGWLVFESSKEKRRLAPVPPDWETMPTEELIALCCKASPQTPRRAGSEPKAADAKPTEAQASEPKPAESQPADVRAAASGPELRPQLEKAEEQLDHTISEVCETPVASRLNTGELIRVEESLALAAEAAKEAVSLRRRMRADRERSGEAVDDDGSPLDSGRDRAHR